eukprot:TRINITY_DN25249_c0_g1_i4.p1 TRINITY_DN25249_c0_g1~~TRINITY_DN25249_c0_g1_i4.p1  ORF type:complete len:278 (+),score=89.25 TRINITY_DN25249_c0_g1_i4:74-907(+)
MRWGSDSTGCEEAACTCTPCCARPWRSARREVPDQLPPSPLRKEREKEKETVKEKEKETAEHVPPPQRPGPSRVAPGHHEPVVHGPLWRRGDVVRAAEHITVGGELALSAGSCGVIEAINEDKIVIRFDSAGGRPCNLLVKKDKFARLRYKDKCRWLQEQAAAEVDKIKASCRFVGPGELEAESPQQVEYYKNEKGQLFKARSPEQAAKKAWRINKKKQQVILTNAAGEQSTHSRADFAVAGAEGRRGGAKFQSGKWNKRDPRRTGHCAYGGWGDGD